MDGIIWGSMGLLVTGGFIIGAWYTEHRKTTPRQIRPYAKIKFVGKKITRNPYRDRWTGKFTTGRKIYTFVSQMRKEQGL